MSDRPRKVHWVKSVQPHFSAAWDGSKTFEVRKDDRDYQPGDILGQREFDGRFYRDRSTVHVIGYLLRDFPGIRKGYCVFSLLDPTDVDVDMAEAAEHV